MFQTKVVWLVGRQISKINFQKRKTIF